MNCVRPLPLSHARLLLIKEGKNMFISFADDTKLWCQLIYWMKELAHKKSEQARKIGCNE